MKDCFICYDLASIEVQLYSRDKDLYMCNSCFDILKQEMNSTHTRKGSYIRDVYSKSRDAYYIYVNRNRKINDILDEDKEDN